MALLEKFLTILAPHDCLVCRREGSLLCTACSQDSFEIIPDRCYRCLALNRDSAVCQKCRRVSKLKHVWVATEYDGIAKQLIHLLKFERTLAAHVPIADHLTSSLPYFQDNTIIVHLPTATSRERARGYDQAEMIARLVAHQKGLRHMPLLLRYGQTRQVGATKKQRQIQAEGMFRVNRPELVNGATILLIDDILTTGASLEAAAQVLKTAGAKQVDAAVFAQKH